MSTVQPATSPVAVATTIRVISNSEVIEEHTEGTVPTAEVLSLIETGYEDGQGYRYALTNGGYGNGAYGVPEGEEVRYQRVERFRVGSEVEQPKGIESAQPCPPTNSSVIGAKLQKLLAEPQLQQEPEVSIVLRQSPTSSLRAPVTFGFPTADELKAYRANRRSRVEVRKQEMAQLQEPVVSFLSSLGAKDIYGSFLTNTISARLPVEAIAAVANHPAIKRINSAGGAGEPAWDGEQAKSSGGENTQVYINDWWDGESQVAMVIDHDFLLNHEGFTDCDGCGTRVVGIANCENSPCTASLPAAARDHGTVVAGIVAGDLRDGQHWYLTSYGTWVDGPGATYVSMLAMTDRFASQISGFSTIHGGGRFQARRYSNGGHAGVWGWQSYGPVYLSNGQYHQINVGGTGNEPSTLNQFKVYAVFPEASPDNVADIDLRVYDQNCATGAQLLGSDLSYDVKSMVRLGPGAAGKALCVKVSAAHVPSGETRPVTLFMYYSYDSIGR